MSPAAPNSHSRRHAIEPIHTADIDGANWCVVWNGYYVARLVRAVGSVTAALLLATQILIAVA